MNLKSVIICIFLCSFLISVCHAETIYLKDGTTIRGTVIRSDENLITLKTSFGQISIEKDKISKIEYEKKAIERKIEEKPKPERVKVEVEKPVHVKVEKVHKHFLISYTRDAMPIKLLNSQKILYANVFDDSLDSPGGKKDGLFNSFSMKYFIFPDVAFGSEFKIVSENFDPGKVIVEDIHYTDKFSTEYFRTGQASVDVKGSIIEVIGTKYFLGKAWGSYLSTGLGFAMFKVTSNVKLSYRNDEYERDATVNVVLADEAIQTTVQGINFILHAGIGRTIGDMLFVGVHLGYAIPVNGEFETWGYKNESYASGSESIEVGYVYPEIQIGGFVYGLGLSVKF